MTLIEAEVLAETLRQAVQRRTSVRIVGVDTLMSNKQPVYRVEVETKDRVVMVIEKASVFQLRAGPVR